MPVMSDKDLEVLNEDLGPAAPKGKDYRPYCLKCSAFKRMELIEGGFRCCDCKNKIGFDLRKS
jgi:hypothetical protein